MNSNSTVINTQNFREYCGSRLPCGLCMITNSPCPYSIIKPEVTWDYKDYITCRDYNVNFTGETTSNNS